MDPKVYGELLTHHRRGNGVDEEALHIRIPPPAVHHNVPQMGSCGDRSYAQLAVRWNTQFGMLKMSELVHTMP